MTDKNGELLSSKESRSARSRNDLAAGYKNSFARIRSLEACVHDCFSIWEKERARAREKERGRGREGEREGEGGGERERERERERIDIKNSV